MQHVHHPGERGFDLFVEIDGKRRGGKARHALGHECGELEARLNVQER
jgi:hypothetical protein